MRFVLFGLLVGVLAAPLHAQNSPAAPSQSTRPATEGFDQRWEDLINLVEGQNSLAARRTGVRELLRLARPEVASRLTAILSGTNKSAKIAVALTVAENPRDFAPAYLEPLVAALDDADDEMRSAAQAALSSAPPEIVLPALRKLLSNTEASARARLASIGVLGGMTQRDALGLLVELVTNPDPALRAAALTALSRAAAIDFGGDGNAATTWWESSRTLELSAWQQTQIERLTRQNRQSEQRVAELETRLSATLRENFDHAAEADRAALLASYLADASTVVRILGLDLSRQFAQESRALPPELGLRIRELLTAPSPRVRAAAVRTVANLREPEDEARLVSMLTAERDVDVRAAIANALGYLGTGVTLRPLLKALNESAGIAEEAAVAVGRLGERDVLSVTERREAVTAVLAYYKSLAADQAVSRERALGALTRLNGPGCGRVFLAAMERAEPTAVRVAGIRGTAQLANPKLAPPTETQPQTMPRDEIVPRGDLVDAIAAAAGDVDPAVRRTAIEALTVVGFSEGHLQALWSRLNPTTEPEEAIRSLAWRGALRLLSGRSLTELDACAARLPEAPNRRALAIELWLNAEQGLVARSAVGVELGEVRARLARERVGADQVEDALTTYRLALKDLQSADSPAAVQVSAEIMMVMLQHNRYSPDQVANLLNGSAARSGRAVWNGLRGQIEALPRATTRVEILAQLQKAPPEWLPADARTEIDGLIDAARRGSPGE